MNGYSNLAWYSVHAILGAVLGFITACIFLLIYYGQTYDMPVPDSLRFKSAFLVTFLIVIVSVGCFYYKPILVWVKSAFAGADE